MFELVDSIDESRDVRERGAAFDCVSLDGERDFPARAEHGWGEALPFGRLADFQVLLGLVDFALSDLLFTLLVPNFLDLQLQGIFLRLEVC